MLYYKVQGYDLLVIWSGFNQTLTMRLWLAIHVSDLQSECNRTKSNKPTTSNFLHTRFVLSN